MLKLNVNATPGKADFESVVKAAQAGAAAIPATAARPGGTRPGPGTAPTRPGGQQPRAPARRVKPGWSSSFRLREAREEAKEKLKFELQRSGECANS